MRKLSLFLLSFFLFCSLAVTVKADTFDLMEVPTYIDNQLGCGEFIGGMIASIVILTLTLVPIIILTKGKSSLMSLYMLVGFVDLGLLVALGWFPIWIFIIIVVAISVGLGKEISGALGGLRK